MTSICASGISGQLLRGARRREQQSPQRRDDGGETRVIETDAVETGAVERRLGGGRVLGHRDALSVGVSEVRALSTSGWKPAARL